MSSRWTNRRERVWADTHTTHKMGWLDAGVEIERAETYRGWTRFVQASGPNPELSPWVNGYKEWWITSDALDDVAPVAPVPVDVDTGRAEPPEEDDRPAPEAGSDEALGRAIRTILVSGGRVCFDSGEGCCC